MAHMKGCTHVGESLGEWDERCKDLFCNQATFIAAQYPLVVGCRELWWCKLIYSSRDLVSGVVGQFEFELAFASGPEEPYTPDCY